MLLTSRNPHHVADTNFLDDVAPALHAANAGRHDQGLAARVRMPRRARAGLECDRTAADVRCDQRAEQHVDPGDTREICRRRLT